MTSLISVIDTRELFNKKQQFNKYLFETPCGELSFLETAYFKILYDIYFISEMENETAYPQYKMINIKSVFIKYDSNHEKYFEVNFRNGESLQIGDNQIVKV